MNEFLEKRLLEGLLKQLLESEEGPLGAKLINLDAFLEER